MITFPFLRVLPCSHSEKRRRRAAILRSCHEVARILCGIGAVAATLYYGLQFAATFAP